MNPRDPNVALVEVVARALGAINERVVYVGGCAVGLLITDAARPPVRATQHVDLLVEIKTRAAYYQLAGELRSAGFAEDQGGVICRWRLGKLKIDVMPTERDVLGFSNRWYPMAVHEAQSTALPSGQVIRLISPPLLLATKIEAFYGRGAGDFMASHDIEDIVTLVDGRAELGAEALAAPPELRDYLREEVDDLLGNPSFLASLSGHLGPTAEDQARVAIVISRFRPLAGL
jgi:predicted nucleotidyltransferase